MAAWFDTGFAESVTYNGSVIQAHISYGGKNSPMGDHATLTVKRSDVTAPSYRDTVVIDGLTWRVFQDEGQNVIIKGDALVWDVPIIKGERKAL